MQDHHNFFTLEANAAHTFLDAQQVTKIFGEGRLLEKLYSSEPFTSFLLNMPLVSRHDEDSLLGFLDSDNQQGLAHVFKGFTVALEELSSALKDEDIYSYATKNSLVQLWVDAFEYMLLFAIYQMLDEFSDEMSEDPPSVTGAGIFAFMSVR